MTSLRYRLAEDDLQEQEPAQRYLRNVSADIVESDKVGEVLATVYLAGLAMNDRSSILEAADSDCQETFDVAQAFYGDDSPVMRWAEEHAEQWDCSSDMIFLRRLWLKNTWRGSDLGLVALKKIIDRFACGCAIAVLEASPLIVVGKSLLPDPSNRTGRRKLQEHYARMGFVKVPKSPWMMLDLRRRWQIKPKRAVFATPFPASTDQGAAHEPH